jgi:hypothetical protein
MRHDDLRFRLVLIAGWLAALAVGRLWRLYCVS